MQPVTRADNLRRLSTAGFLIAIGGAAAIAGATSAFAADACASLKDLKLDDTTITAAETRP